MLLAKLPHLDEYIEARQRAAEYYTNALKGDARFLTPVVGRGTTHAFHQYTLRCVGVDRDAVREQLAAKGVPAMVYYPIPLHQQKAYQDARYKAGDFPVAEQLAREVLSLPMHTELDEEQLEYIVGSL